MHTYNFVPHLSGENFQIYTQELIINNYALLICSFLIEIVAIKTELSVIVHSYFILGTHDAQNCTTECFRPNTVNVSCAFPVNSTALGYLSILCFDNSSRVMFFAASRGDMSNSDLNISISGVPSGNYSVVVFDIGNSGVPPVLSADYDGSGWPYALAAGIQNVTVTEPGRSGDENENMTVKTEGK